MPLGEILIAQGRITRAELDAALSYRQERGIKLGQALVALNLVTQSEVATSLRSQGKVHCIRLTPGIVAKEIAELLGEERARSLQAIAINKIAGVVTVAMEDPSEVYNVDAISVQLDAPILPVYAEPAQIERCIDHVFKRRTIPNDTTESASSASELAELGAGLHAARSGADLDEPSLEHAVNDMVGEVLNEALAIGASDIHIEPRHEGVHTRLRVDGGLVECAGFPTSWAAPALTHLKRMAGLDVDERRLPQSGSTGVSIRGRRIDLRVRTSPTLWGEGAVIRLLDTARERIGLADLSLREEDRSDLEAMLHARGGLVFVTGPAGSGRTTTLYALLERLQAPDKKFVTIEDPVEIRLEAATQISTNPRIGLTYARVLRSIVQQDADVVLVGDMRDEETATLAVDAALSGRLVLSTMHTAGTVESITRLIDLGVRPYLVADAFAGAVAQRLVRRICTSCRREAKVRPELLEYLGFSATATFFEGAGCDACRGTGYKGRVGLFEVLRTSSELRALVREAKSPEALRAAVCRAGLSLLRDDGISRARAGDTTLEEVYAVTARL
jgi:type II secretory ATPase GspE/PulE/Tfp pilus assembly ATPase PilB-like protein